MYGVFFCEVRIISSCFTNRLPNNKRSYY